LANDTHRREEEEEEGGGGGGGGGEGRRTRRRGGGGGGRRTPTRDTLSSNINRTRLSLASTLGESNDRAFSEAVRDLDHFMSITQGDILGTLDLDFAGANVNEDRDKSDVSSTAHRSPFGPEPEALVRSARLCACGGGGGWLIL
jgi:hypothetical protein